VHLGLSAGTRARCPSFACEALCFGSVLELNCFLFFVCLFVLFYVIRDLAPVAYSHLRLSENSCVFRRIFLHAIMDKSAEGGFKRIGNTMTVRKKPPDNREQLQKFPLNLKFLY